eukprot:scaffold273_cov89-Cylindrotheca_fusiformis.AAC.3
MQCIDSEHRELVQHVARIDAETSLSKRKSPSNPYSQSSRSASSSSDSLDSGNHMDHPDSDLPSPPTSAPYEAMRRIQQNPEPAHPNTDRYVPK